MSKVAINTQYVDFISSNNHPSINRGFIGSFNITTTFQRLSIREDDSIIIASPVKDDLSFLAEGIITKVGPTKKLPPPTRAPSNNLNENQQPLRELYQHNYQVEVIRDLTTNNLLSDLEYSIKAVYRFSKPIVHFQQQIRDLTQDDYDTIVNGWVYATRTAFGRLVNALPRQNKLEFMLQAMDYFQTVDFKNVPLFTGVGFLYDYINKRILSRGRLIVATNDLIKKELSDIVPSEEIGFFNPSNSKTDTLSPQAELFEKLFSLERQSDIRKLIQKNISEDSQLQERFLQIFKSETWPIDLTI